MFGLRELLCIADAQHHILIQKPADEVVRELHQPETLRAAESPFPWAEPNYPFQIARWRGVDFFKTRPPSGRGGARFLKNAAKLVISGFL